MQKDKTLPQVLSAPTEPAPSPEHWKIAYAVAIYEQDPSKKAGLCDQARRAINDRILQQPSCVSGGLEREVLREALRQITMHLAGPNAIHADQSHRRRRVSATSKPETAKPPTSVELQTL
jgi:hypothetical protein